MTRRFPGCIGHCRPSLLTVALTLSLFYLVHTAAGADFLALPDLSNHVNKALNGSRFQIGQRRARAVDLAARQSLLDIYGGALLIPASLIHASTTEPSASAAALLRSSPHYRFRTVLQANTPIQHGVLEGGLYLTAYGDPALVMEEHGHRRVGVLRRARSMTSGRWQGTSAAGLVS